MKDWFITLTAPKTERLIIVDVGSILCAEELSEGTKLYLASGLEVQITESTQYILATLRDIANHV